MMRRKSMMVVLLLALSLGAGMPVYWRAQSRSLPTPHAARVAVQAAGRGYPWINLRDGYDLPVGAEANGLLQREAAQPLALAAGDFDEDGVPDLLSGYASADGGVLVWQRGNVDAIYPDTPAAEQRRARGEFTDAPFLSPARVLALPAAADFVGAGDFNADGHVDVVAATQGSATLYWLAGDGRGGLGPAQAIKLPGSVTALTVGEINRADGLADVVVAVNTDDGAQALVFEGPEGAFSRAPEVIALPAEAAALALGQLDDQYEMDLAVAAGHDVLIVHGRDRCLSVGEERQAEVKAAVIETHAQPFDSVALAVGDFSGDARNEIAVLAADGVVQVLGQDARGKTLSKLLGAVATRSRAEAVVANDKTAAPLLVRARVSVSGYDDLVVIDQDAQQLQILTGGMLRGEEAQAAAEPRAPVTLAVAGEPVAVLPMRLNMDALSDLVVLKRGGESSLAAALTAPTATFTVNSTGSQSDSNTGDGKCETAPGNGICTLTAAIQQANTSMGADLINFSPSISSISFTSLPNITDVVTIDGGASRVEISNLGFGVSILGGNSTIRGLVLNRISPGSPGTITLVTKGGNIVEGCYLGTDTAGASAAFGTCTNCDGIVISTSPNNLIGGTAAAARNLIAPPAYGIRLNANSPGTKVQGNYIGIDASGTKALGSDNGVSLFSNGSSNLQLGGTEAGAGNVIAGIKSQAVRITSDSTALIQGNLIGTNANGTAVLKPNGGCVFLSGSGASAVGFTLGGTTLAARNIISGCDSGGVNLDFSAASLVQGNYIGTDKDGTKALGNTFYGVLLSSNANASTVGGTVTGARNLISANGSNGGVFIQGSNNRVQGNYIGTDMNGTANLGNGGNGITVNGNNNLIGGTESGAANISAFNSSQGIALSGSAVNAVRRNSIFSNGTPVTTNAGIQNNNPANKTPVLTTTAGTTQGTLSGAPPNTAHVIEFFANPTCGTDTQGKTFISDVTVTTNASGAASFSVPAGQNVTATATATGSSTSPFSACAAGSAPGTLTLSTPTLNFNTTLGSNPATQTVTLSNTGGGALTWQAAATTTSGGNWLMVTPPTGPLNAGQAVPLTVAVNASALAAGTYNGTLTITSANASNSPRTVAVTLTVTGCAATLNFANAAPDQSQDTLELVNPMPNNDTPVSGALLKLGGLKVTVRYLLQSRANATLRVSLFDEDGNARASFAGEIDITRPQSCPNPLPTREFNLLPLSVDFTTLIGGSVPTGLKLAALLIDPATNSIFKRADLTYKVVPDVSAFESNPTINGKSAPDGSSFPEDGKIKFDCGLRYQLTNDVRGKLRLEAFNGFSEQSIALKDLVTVVATPQPVTLGFALDFEFAVPPDVPLVRISAALLAENGTVLKRAVPLIYRRGAFRIELNYALLQNPMPVAINPLPVLVAGDKVRRDFELISAGTEELMLTVKDELNLPLNTPVGIVLSEKLKDGTVRRQDPQLSYLGPYPNLPRPAFFIFLPDNVPYDVDVWELKLVYSPPGKDQLVSTPLLLPIERLRIVAGQCRPPKGIELQRGITEKIGCALEYNVARAGASQLFAQAEYNSISGEPTPPPIKLLDLKAGDHSEANPPVRDFDVRVPDNAKVTVVKVYFYLSNAADERRASTPAIEFSNFTKEVQFPGGITSVNTGLGVAANLLQNGVNRTTKVARKGVQFKGFLDSLKLGAELEGGANAAAPFALRYAEAASLLRDFIGVNAYWEFTPPIPADGGFVADLTFNYDAEMLPDDPNFSEAALKVASFDPDSGQLISYPTTVNTSAKTATARVNGLARFYTLGVFGPFAQRSLNFPVLHSGNAFSTRFNLVNAGTTDAALTLRAYDDAGTDLQAPNLVNPLTATLAAARMLTGSIGDLFKAITPLDGWVQTRANRNTVAGYELLTSGNGFDGLNALSGYDSALILPEAVYDTTQTTEVHLANATNFSGLVQLELHDATGRLAGSEEVRLEAKARFAEQLPDIFPNLAQPFTGYLLILSERDLGAAAVQVLDKEISALNAQPLGGGATKLYAPHLPLGSSAAVRLTLVNPSAQTANLTLRLVNEPGVPVTAPVNLTLDAGQQLQRDLNQLFNLNRAAAASSALVLESNLAGLAGAVTLLHATGAQAFRATLPLESAPANRLLFAHLNTVTGSFTELGLFNPSAQAARVTLACFNPDGASLGQTSVNVPAGTVFGDLLSNLVSGARGQAAGYFTLSADQPILAGAAFGTDTGSALAGLPPQILPSTTTNALATVSAASFTGQTLAANSIVAAFGVNLANSVVTANQVPLPASLADTIVEVRDSLGVARLAPLFFVAPGQINYLIPPGTANGTATITVTNGAGALSLGNVTIANVAPGLFTANANGQGVAAAVALRIKANGAQSYELIARFDTATQRFVSTPLDLGPAGEQVFLLLFGTGLRGGSSLTATTALIGGVSAQVSYAGAQGDLVGLDQVNLAVPRALIGRGEVDLVLTVDGSTANTVRVAFAGSQTCSYALSSASQNVPSGGGAGSVNVTTQNGCAWTATSNADFITITGGASGAGNGAVNFTVAANPGSQRTGTLTIAGQTFTVTQTGRPCSYSIPITSQSFNANANTGSLNVTATSGCAWTATSNAGFLTITSGANGNGNGTVNFAVAANTAASQRSGTMTIAGITFTVTQTAAAAFNVRRALLSN